MVSITILNTGITTSGSFAVQKISSDALYLVYNLSGRTSAGSVVITMAEADPNNLTTIITGGQTATVTVSSNSSGILPLVGISSSCVLVTWTLTGGTFTTGSLNVDEKFLGDANVTATISGTVTVAGTVTNTESVAATTSSLNVASISVSSFGNNTLVAGTSGQTVRIFKMFLTFDGATDATFMNGASTSFTGAMPFGANGSIVLDLDTVPWFVTTSGNAFVLNLSAGVAVTGTVYYTKS